MKREALENFAPTKHRMQNGQREIASHVSDKLTRKANTMDIRGESEKTRNCKDRKL